MPYTLWRELFGPRCSIPLADVCPPSFGLKLNNSLGSCSLVTMATGKSGTKGPLVLGNAGVPLPHALRWKSASSPSRYSWGDNKRLIQLLNLTTIVTWKNCIILCNSTHQDWLNTFPSPGSLMITDTYQQPLFLCLFPFGLALHLFQRRRPCCHPSHSPDHELEFRRETMASNRDTTQHAYVETVNYIKNCGTVCEP